MNIKEGDPILSRDGSKIMAYWAKSMTLLYGNSILIPMRQAKLSASFSAIGAADEEIPEMRTLEIVAYFQAPDRTYWRENSFGNVDGWEEMQEWFRSAPTEPGPSPAGMVAAYDLVLEHHRFAGPSDFVMENLQQARD
jgi:hypothetical protein